MRIAIDIRSMLEPQRCGVATYAAEVTRRLCADRERDHVLFCNAGGRRIPDDVPAAGPNVTHRFFRYPNRLLNASVAVLRRPLFERFVPDADAVYLPNLNFIETRKPLFLTVHDLSFLRYPRFFSRKQRLWHRLVRPDRLIRDATGIIAVSSHTKDDVAELFGVPPERITVASPAVDRRYFSADATATALVRNRYGLRRPYVLSLGALEPRKNITGLIAAFEGLDEDVDLVITGGKGWLNREIFDRATRSPAKDRIRFLGYVPETHKPGLYAGARVFAYPSFYEGFGMPPLESMAAGTPVAASATSSLGEVVGGAGLLIDPHDAGDLRDALRSLIEDDTLRARCIARGRERAEAFTWERTADAVRDALAVLT